MKKVLVNNIPEGKGQSFVKEMLDKVGVQSGNVTVPDTVSGDKPRYALVEFENDAEAERAIAELHDKEVEGGRLTVTPATSGREEANDTVENPS